MRYFWTCCVTVLYALALTVLAWLVVGYTANLGSTPLTILMFAICMVAYTGLINRRMEHAHPYPPPPQAERRPLDRLITRARQRDFTGADQGASTANAGCACDTRGPAAGSDSPACEVPSPAPPPEGDVKVVSGTPPRGALGIEPLAGTPAPAVGKDPCYRISLIDPREEQPFRVYWINESNMVEVLRRLQRTWLGRNGPVQPRVKIEPSFDLRLANLKAKQERKMDLIYVLPEGLRPRYVGLLT